MLRIWKLCEHTFTFWRIVVGCLQGSEITSFESVREPRTTKNSSKQPKICKIWSVVVNPSITFWGDVGVKKWSPFLDSGAQSPLFGHEDISKFGHKKRRPLSQANIPQNGGIDICFLHLTLLAEYKGKFANLTFLFLSMDPEIKMHCKRSVFEKKFSVHCHYKLSGNKDCHESRLSVL